MNIYLTKCQFSPKFNKTMKNRVSFRHKHNGLMFLKCFIKCKLDLPTNVTNFANAFLFVIFSQRLSNFSFNVDILFYILWVKELLCLINFFCERMTTDCSLFYKFYNPSYQILTSLIVDYLNTLDYFFQHWDMFKTCNNKK